MTTCCGDPTHDAERLTAEARTVWNAGLLEHTNPTTGTTTWPSDHRCGPASCDEPVCTGGPDPTRPESVGNGDGTIDGESPCGCRGHEPHDPTGRGCALASDVGIWGVDSDDRASGACCACLVTMLAQPLAPDVVVDEAAIFAALQRA